MKEYGKYKSFIQYLWLNFKHLSSKHGDKNSVHIVYNCIICRNIMIERWSIFYGQPTTKNTLTDYNVELLLIFNFSFDIIYIIFH